MGVIGYVNLVGWAKGPAHQAPESVAVSAFFAEESTGVKLTSPRLCWKWKESITPVRWSNTP